LSEQTGIYVFCAIHENQPQTFGSIIMNGEERLIYTISYQNAAMVVCSADVEVLPTRENLFAHQKVLTRMMEKYCLIPMSFGNVFNSEEDVLLITEHLYEQLELLFPQIENKMEVGLKIIAKKQWLDTEVENDPILHELKKEINDKNVHVSYYDQIRIGELAQKFILSLQQKMETDIHSSLSELAVASKTNTPSTENMLLNAAYLVDRQKEETFDQKVNELYELYKDQVDFQYTGPWPAYNFVNIKLKIEGNL
jgi:hypothetical protein